MLGEYSMLCTITSEIIKKNNRPHNRVKDLQGENVKMIWTVSHIPNLNQHRLRCFKMSEMKFQFWNSKFKTSFFKITVYNITDVAVVFLSANMSVEQYSSLSRLVKKFA